MVPREVWRDYVLAVKVNKQAYGSCLKNSSSFPEDGWQLSGKVCCQVMSNVTRLGNSWRIVAR